MLLIIYHRVIRQRIKKFFLPFLTSFRHKTVVTVSATAVAAENINSSWINPTNGRGGCIKCILALNLAPNDMHIGGVKVCSASTDTERYEQ